MAYLIPILDYLYLFTLHTLQQQFFWPVVQGHIEFW